MKRRRSMDSRDEWIFGVRVEIYFQREYKRERWSEEGD